MARRGLSTLEVDLVIIEPPDLSSHERHKVEGALADLREAMDGMDEASLPRLDVSRILAALGTPPPQAALLDLVRLVERYQAFDPPMTAQDRAHALGEIVLLTGDHRAALETNLYVKARPELLQALFDRLGAQLDYPDATPHVGRLVSYLLNAKPAFRASVVEALRTPPWRDVHAWLLPELDEGER